jgi:VanZ family protein
MPIALILLSLGMAAVTIGCLTPAHRLPPLPNDKLLHFAAFGCLSLLAGQLAQTRMELAAWLLGLSIAGCIIECLQSWVPGRKFCWRDIAANTAGIVVAALCAPALAGS